MGIRVCPDIIYMGSPWFAAELLSFIIEEKLAYVRAVWTAPPRVRTARRGRTREDSLVASTPVGKVAEKWQIPLYAPERLGEADCAAWRGYKVTMGLIVAYGKILPRKLYSLPQHGTYNLHFSLLPKHRGANPIAGAILSGERETGITIQRVGDKLDAGAIALQQKILLADSNDRGVLNRSLLAARQQFRIFLGGVDKKHVMAAGAAGAAGAVVNGASRAKGAAGAANRASRAKGAAGAVNGASRAIGAAKEAAPWQPFPLVAQDEALATYTRKFKLSDVALNYHDSAETFHRKILAFSTRHGGYFFIKKQQYFVENHSYVAQLNLYRDKLLQDDIIFTRQLSQLGAHARIWAAEDRVGGAAAATTEDEGKRYKFTPAIPAETGATTKDAGKWVGPQLLHTQTRRLILVFPSHPAIPLELLTLKRAGKQAVTAHDFINGIKLPFPISVHPTALAG